MIKKVNFKYLFFALSALCLILFAVLIIALKTVDLGIAGESRTEVGFSSLNGAFFSLIGDRSDLWYTVSELLGYLAIATAGGFALLGLIQLIQRKSLAKVDKDIYLIAAVYAVLAAVYVIFEVLVINYRPYLIDGELEASFPSSHTMLALTILLTAAHQFLTRIKCSAARITTAALATLVALASVAARVLSGLHWLTDIVGGVLISLAIVFAYLGVYEIVTPKE